MSENKNLKAGMIYATLAYLGWGFFPIYWKFLQHVPVLQILSHRVLWAFVFYTLILFYKERKLYFFRPESAGSIISLLLASVLLMGNWLVYIYAVNSDQIVESSLGYFINPLMNIVIGVIILKERLSLFQSVATGFAAVGVLIISFAQGHIPWIAIFLAVTFSCYGLIKKKTSVSGLKSNQFESLVFIPVAILFLFTQEQTWLKAENVPLTAALLAGSGLITGLPLIFFAEATRRIPYFLLGFFQFLAPTIQFLTGVFIFGEPLSELKLRGFVFIWVAGVLLILNTWWVSRKNKQLPQQGAA